MNKFNYKWPILNKQQNSLSPVQNISLITKDTNKVISTNDKVLAVGIPTLFFYYIMMGYIYITGMGEKWKLNTLSDSIQNCEKKGSTTLIIIFMALFLSLFAYQNLYGTDSKKAIIIAFNYIFTGCLILFMFFPPKENGKKLKFHGVLAFLVLLSYITNSFLIVNVYKDYYKDEEVLPLVIIGYIIAICSVIAMLIMLYHAFGGSDKLVAIIEFICIAIFGAYLAIFIQFPPIPNVDLSCVMIPK